ncbi:MAG TPA: hypothetical protein VIL20_14975 [Sandaracinaceae bacterium]
MLTNLLRPWVLARLLSGAAVAILCAFALVVAWKVLSRWRVGATSEGQLALERRAELVAAVVQVALLVAVLDLGLTVLTADRLTHSIRGAMCAWGVFDASPWGFVALGTSALAAAGCALWVVLHRLDLRLERPALTRRKFVALFALAPIVWIDLFATAAWALDLDMRVVASCCSIALDDALGAAGTGDAGPRTLAAGSALGAAAVAALAALTARHRPTRAATYFAALASAVALIAAIPAILWFVAPHAYETPHHLCPFCLLHADAFGLGWPLFSALFGAAIGGLALGLVEAQRRASGEPAVVSTMQRRLGGWTAALWIATMALGAAPVVRYALVTGGASLFGGV